MGNLGLLFMLLFFIYAALGVELFGELGEFSSAKTTSQNSSTLYFQFAFGKLQRSTCPVIKFDFNVRELVVDLHPMIPF